MFAGWIEPFDVYRLPYIKCFHEHSIKISSNELDFDRAKVLWSAVVISPKFWEIFVILCNCAKFGCGWYVESEKWEISLIGFVRGNFLHIGLYKFNLYQIDTNSCILWISIDFISKCWF